MLLADVPINYPLPQSSADCGFDIAAHDNRRPGRITRHLDHAVGWRGEAGTPGVRAHVHRQRLRAEWDAEQIADQWGDLPVEVWAVNYAGYGKSEGFGPAVIDRASALAAFDAIKTRAAGRPVFVSGRSIGTTAALYVAANRKVDGVILHSPPPLRQLIMGRFGWWNLWLAAIPVSLGVPADLDSIENARHVSAPGIFIVTGADTLVPPAYQQKVIDAYAGPEQVIVMAGVDHNDSIPGRSMVELHGKLGQMLAGP